MIFILKSANDNVELSANCTMTTTSFLKKFFSFQWIVENAAGLSSIKKHLMLLCFKMWQLSFKKSFRLNGCIFFSCENSFLQLNTMFQSRQLQAVFISISSTKRSSTMIFLWRSVLASVKIFKLFRISISIFSRKKWNWLSK